MALRRLDRSNRPAAIYLHIGGPSTGTTYLQRLMYANRAALEKRGYLLPGRSWRDVVLATHDALSFGRPADRVRTDLTEVAGGRWDRLAEEMTAHRGRAVVLSMEFLCWAKPAAAERIVRSLGDADVHVVVTVRDSAAVLRSQWQTNCRNGEEVPLRRMVWGLRQAVRQGGEPASRPERMIDRGLGIPRVIDTWAPLVGPDRLHVVTVPLRNDDPDLLWKRFAGVVGLRPGRYRARSEQSNASLGLPSSELMRLLNIALGPVARTDYLRTMKGLLARDILAGRAGQERKVTLNRSGHDLSARWNNRVREAITSSGADLVGSLDDLPTVKPDESVPTALEMPTDEELLSAAEWARRGLDEAILRLQGQVAALGERDRTDDPSGPRTAARDEVDDPDDEGDGPESDDGPDDSEDAGLDRQAVLDRQLSDRTPEVALALDALVEQVRRAMALGAELGSLRARQAASG